MSGISCDLCHGIIFVPQHQSQMNYKLYISFSSTLMHSKDYISFSNYFILGLHQSWTSDKGMLAGFVSPYPQTRTSTAIHMHTTAAYGIRRTPTLNEYVSSILLYFRSREMSQTNPVTTWTSELSSHLQVQQNWINSANFTIFEICFCFKLQTLLNLGGREC